MNKEKQRQTKHGLNYREPPGGHQRGVVVAMVNSFWIWTESVNIYWDRLYIGCVSDAERTEIDRSCSFPQVSYDLASPSLKIAVPFTMMQKQKPSKKKKHPTMKFHNIYKVVCCLSQGQKKYTRVPFQKVWVFQRRIPDSSRRSKGPHPKRPVFSPQKENAIGKSSELPVPWLWQKHLSPYVHV